MGLFQRFKKTKKQDDSGGILKDLDGMDDSQLAVVGRDYDDLYIRNEAIKRIKDQAVLIDLAKTGPTESRGFAVCYIGDESVLIDIARRDSDANVRMLAISCIKDKNALRSMLKGEWDSKVKDVIRNRLDEL
jgi:hypothetical protein